MGLMGMGCFPIHRSSGSRTPAVNTGPLYIYIYTSLKATLIQVPCAGQPNHNSVIKHFHTDFSSGSTRVCAGLPAPPRALGQGSFPSLISPGIWGDVGKWDGGVPGQGKDGQDCWQAGREWEVGPGPGTCGTHFQAAYARSKLLTWFCDTIWGGTDPGSCIGAAAALFGVREKIPLASGWHSRSL